jgi:uncharacterized membrane protein
MQCPVCHNEVAAQAAFCGHCGAPIAAAAAGAVPPQAAYIPPPVAGYPPPGSAAPSSGLSANAASALSYVFLIPAILFLVIEPYNKIPLVRFHSFQSIGLFIVWVVMWIFSVVISMVLIFIPVIHLLLIPIHLLIGLGLFITWLVCVLKASKGEWFKLPIIGDFAMKQAQS